MLSARDSPRDVAVEVPSDRPVLAVTACPAAEAKEVPREVPTAELTWAKPVWPTAEEVPSDRPVESTKELLIALTVEEPVERPVPALVELATPVAVDVPTDSPTLDAIEWPTALAVEEQTQVPVASA
jgi:hypothetical protein